jgi:hypothetical protein
MLGLFEGQLASRANKAAFFLLEFKAATGTGGSVRPGQWPLSPRVPATGIGELQTLAYDFALEAAELFIIPDHFAV